MNTTLKHWKEAATVILAAGTKYKRRVESLLRETPAFGSGLTKPAFDYKVLLLKRSGRSVFMPNAYVFPGGLVDPSDFSSEWLEVFKAFRHLPKFGIATVKQPQETRPPIFATDRKEFGSPIPGDVAFRICAVRETFEESGVLLVVPSEEANTLNTDDQDENDRPGLTALSDQWNKSLIAKWRSLVLENSSNFIRMCRELECLPNIWALYEWGNWITPIGLPQPQRRYDTAFYMCCLEDTPDTLQDQKEIEHYKWSTPPEILHSYWERELWIAPPQLYDIGRMCNFPLLSDLQDFARQRSIEGCEQCHAVILKATDCNIHLLPARGVPTSNARKDVLIKHCEAACLLELILSKPGAEYKQEVTDNRLKKLVLDGEVVRLPDPDTLDGWEDSWASFPHMIQSIVEKYFDNSDSLYPEKPDSSMSTEKCLEELQKNSPNLHRIVTHDPYQITVYINITPKYKHLPPLIASRSKHNSKL